MLKTIFKSLIESIFTLIFAIIAGLVIIKLLLFKLFIIAVLSFLWYGLYYTAQESNDYSDLEIYNYFLAFALFGFVGLPIIVKIWNDVSNDRGNLKKRGFFERFAKKHSLEYEYQKHHRYNKIDINSCHGEIGQQWISIYEEFFSAGKGRGSFGVYTHIVIEGTPFPFEFKIGKEHVFRKLGKLVGFSDIEIDNDILDKKFFMKSKDEQAFKKMLKPEIQARLKELSSIIEYPIEHNDSSCLSYKHYRHHSRGFLSTEKEFQNFEKVFDFMLALSQQKN